MFIDFLKHVVGFIFLGPILGDQGVLGDLLIRCRRFSTQWLDTSESNHPITSCNQLGAKFSTFNYSEGVKTHCRAMDMGMWWMIIQSDIVPGQSTLPD